LVNKARRLKNWQTLCELVGLVINKWLCERGKPVLGWGLEREATPEMIGSARRSAAIIRRLRPFESNFPRQGGHSLGIHFT
jgi:hypothetical protein